MDTERRFNWSTVLAYVVIVLIRYYLFGQYQLPCGMYPITKDSSSPPLNDKLIYSSFLKSVNINSMNHSLSGREN
jgi:hypothetical protein